MVGLDTEFIYVARFAIKLLKTIGFFFNDIEKKLCIDNMVKSCLFIELTLTQIVSEPGLQNIMTCIYIYSSK